MSKKSAKIAVTYFVTIIAALVIVGGMGFILLRAYISGSDTPKKSTITPADVDVVQTLAGEEFVPTEEDCQTILFIYEAEKRPTGVCFVLARFLPTQNKAVIVPLQSDLCIQLNSKVNTIYEFYRLGGSSDAVKAVEAATGITVDKYLKFNNESFEIFSNCMGNITYDIPYNLIYENETTGESTIIQSGEQILDSQTLRKLLTFPEFKGGEEYRAKVLGAVAAELVNSGAGGMLKNNFDTVFTEIINSDIETNITRYDYDERKNALNYVLENTSEPASVVIPSGAYNENECYLLDESFVEALPRWFYLE